MNISTGFVSLSIGILILIAADSASAQDGNAFSERYRQNANNNNYASNYRDNYRQNIRLFNDLDRRHNRRFQYQQDDNPLAVPKPSTFQQGTRKTLNLPSRSDSSSGSGSRSSSESSSRDSGGSGGSGFNMNLLLPPALMRSFLSGEFFIAPFTSETTPDELELDLEVTEPVETQVLSPSELLFEEGIELFRGKNYRAATKNFEHLLEIDPDDAAKRVAYGLCFAAVKKYQAASIQISKAFDVLNDPEDVYTLIQTIYSNKQEFSVHYKQVDSKVRQSVEDDELNNLSSIFHAVWERY